MPSIYTPKMKKNYEDIQLRRADGEIVVVPGEFFDPQWFASQATRRRRKIVSVAEAERRLSLGWHQNADGRWLRPSSDREWFHGKGDYVVTP